MFVELFLVNISTVHSSLSSTRRKSSQPADSCTQSVCPCVGPCVCACVWSPWQPVSKIPILLFIFLSKINKQEVRQKGRKGTSCEFEGSSDDLQSESRVTVKLLPIGLAPPGGYSENCSSFLSSTKRLCVSPAASDVSDSDWRITCGWSCSHKMYSTKRKTLQLILIISDNYYW